MLISENNLYKNIKNLTENSTGEDVFGHNLKILLRPPTLKTENFSLEIDIFELRDLPKMDLTNNGSL
ncbi:hypothetical protein MHBO_001816 [Bonamia ostreae]|uniref:Uncharacterized protein n=1 Tax=Bonamia ostreae TaxID=126728 RepID=A0ABV2AKX1_9EUKA